jgi:hypothetical protein
MYLYLYDGEKHKSEPNVQPLLKVLLQLYIELKGVFTFREVAIEEGECDFVFVHQGNKVLLEVKNSDHPKLLHGLSEQLRRYLLAEKVTHGIFLVLNYEDAEKTKAIQAELKKKAEFLKMEYGFIVSVKLIDCKKPKTTPSGSSKK